MRDTRHEAQKCHHDETSPSSSPSALQSFSSYMIIISTMLLAIIVIIVIIVITILQTLPPIVHSPKNQEYKLKGSKLYTLKASG